jgi:micrococcal nuclease
MSQKIQFKFKKGKSLNNSLLLFLMIIILIIYWQKPEILENLNNENSSDYLTEKQIAKETNLIQTEDENIQDNILKEEGVSNELEQDGTKIWRVKRIIDGDTFVLMNNERVRLIGIDTPERGEYFFDEATEALSKLILNQDLILKKDISETDRYGRLLRHIYVDDLWVNKVMIENGYAKIATFPPDVAHVEIFQQAEQNARENQAGLWQ